MRLDIDFEKITYEDLDSAYHQIREKWIQRTTDRLTSKIKKETNQAQDSTLEFIWSSGVDVFGADKDVVFSQNDSETWRR